MGAAFAEGMLSFFKAKNIDVKKVVHLSPADVSDFSAVFPNLTFQIDIDFDPVLAYKNLDDYIIIKNIKRACVVNNPYQDKFGHMYTKQESFVWKWFEDLERVGFTYSREKEKTSSIGNRDNPLIVKIKTKYYTINGNKHKTQFKRIIIDNLIYEYCEGEEYKGNTLNRAK